jgi:hypothetical protein
VFIRCAPGQTNTLNHLFAEAPPEIRRCAPTIDELRYETVSLSVTQPGVRGPSGFWVVTRWEMLQPRSDSDLDESGLPYTDFAERQVEQIVPPSDAEVTGLLEAFLRARENGEGAERYLVHTAETIFMDMPPLLYATISGAPYERSEIEKVQGPVWPSGWTLFRVRLFAEGGTVVEQLFHVVRHDGQLGLLYGWFYEYDDLPTTEDGESVPVPFSLLDGEVTFAAAPPWRYQAKDPIFMALTNGRNQNVVIAADPLPMGTGCERGPAAADAEALARSIMTDPDFETVGTAPVRIAGIDGLQIDVVVTNADNESCFFRNWVLSAQTIDGRWRARLYLIDYPGESAQVLTIAVIAPEEAFERVLEEATPIVESLEIHTR